MSAIKVKNSNTGCLYVVATPIGNLGDITLRALETLQSCDLILAEDTRLSRRLLDHYKISAPLLSCHEHNEEERISELAERIMQGQNLALISDAGTPAVSDPGFKLVRALASMGLKIVPIPGPNAAITAISAAGLPSNSFAFAGFAPKKNKARKEFLTRYLAFPGTLIFYESPHRVGDLLAALKEVFGDRPVVLARELTKVYEEFIRGGLEEVAAQLAKRDGLKGECVLLLDNTGNTETVIDPGALEAEIKTALAGENASASALAKGLAKKYGLPKGQVYQEVLRLKNDD